jgi:predicted nucleotidyltransferase
MKRGRDEVLKVLQEHRDEVRRYGVRRLGLFGSCARGEATETSDLDFVALLSKLGFES